MGVIGPTSLKLSYLNYVMFTPGVVAKYASYFPTLEYAVAFNKYQNLQNIPLIDKFVDAYSV